MGKILAWFDVGTDWRLGIDRFIRLCAAAIVANWVLDMLYVLPVDDSRSIIQFVKSSIPFGGGDE